MKDKKVRHILQEGWLRVLEQPAPLNHDVAAAALLHNASYVSEGNNGNGASGDGRRSNWDGWNHRDIDNRPVVIEPKLNLDWTCEVADVKGCPIVKEPIVEIPCGMYQAWIELANSFDTEWMAYLIGTIDAITGRGKVTEMYFPPQSASGAHVEMPDEGFRARPETIAAVHSHVKMEAFFSKTDEDHANWPIEIVVNARGESKMVMRVRLECGRYSRVHGKVMLTGLSANQVYIDQLKQAMKPNPYAKVEGLSFDGVTIYE
jgi:proteasome lid subunit RPN8/RPN11